MQLGPDYPDPLACRRHLVKVYLHAGRFVEAEPMVVEGYEPAHRGCPRHRLTEAAVRVVRFYADRPDPDRAAAWKAKLGLAELPADVFAPP